MNKKRLKRNGSLKEEPSRVINHPVALSPKSLVVQTKMSQVKISSVGKIIIVRWHECYS